MEQPHRLRLTVDVIYKGPKLPPSVTKLVARNLATHAHVLAFEDIKNIEVVFGDRDSRVVYAHHHDGSGDYCSNCLRQAEDGYDQEDLT